MEKSTQKHSIIILESPFDSKYLLYVFLFFTHSFTKHQNGADKMKSSRTTKRTKIDTMRLKDIIAQLTDIIYIQCNAREQDITIVLDQFTNITQDELSTLNIFYPQDDNKT